MEVLDHGGVVLQFGITGHYLGCDYTLSYNETIGIWDMESCFMKCKEGTVPMMKTPLCFYAVSEQKIEGFEDSAKLPFILAYNKLSEGSRLSYYMTDEDIFKLCGLDINRFLALGIDIKEVYKDSYYELVPSGYLGVNNDDLQGAFKYSEEDYDLYL